MLLADVADRSLDVQYDIWHADLSGRLRFVASRASRPPRRVCSIARTARRLRVCSPPLATKGVPLPSSTRVLVLLGVLSLASLAASPAAAQEASRCLSVKYKAVGQYLKKQTACRAKAAGKGVAVDAVCQQKAGQKLAKAFQKAEAKGDCPATADLAAIENLLESDLEIYANALEVKLICCDLGGGLCSAVLDDAACVAAGGVLGLGNTHCDGAAGGCVEEPAAAGCCHDLLEGANRFPCVGGPGANQPSCDAAGGTFSTDAVCANSGLCTALP